MTATRGAAALRGWGWAYGAALRLLPGGLRAERGEEMRACHEEMLRSAHASGGGGAVAVAALGELADVMKTAWRLRWSAHPGVRSGRSFRARGAFMDALRQDIRYAVRGWARRPGFVVVAMLTLGLGIGANTTMFSVADAVLFRPLSHREPERLAMVWSTVPGLDWRRAPLSYPNYVDWRAQSRSWTDLAAFTGGGSATVEASGGLPGRIQRSHVSANLFVVLGNRALHGRTLVEADDEPGAARVAVVSERYAGEHLGGAAAAVGEALRIDGESHTVAGVMPAEFAFPFRGVDLWLPLGPTAAGEERDLRFLQVIGRLAPGVTLESAEREMGELMARLERAYPEANEGVRLWLESRHIFMVGDVRPLLLVLLGAVGVVLVIACANLANLMLARGAARTRELAVRAALGAGRRRLARQLLTESALLGLLGGGVGVVLAYASSGVLLRLAPLALPRGETIGVDARTLLFTAAIALASGLVVGVLPALRTARPAPGAALREGARGGTAGPSRHRLQRVLVVSQVSLALVLLVGAGLLVNSLNRLLSVDPGFRPDGLLTMHVSLPESRYQEAEDVGRFFDELLARAAALPGVERVGAAWAPPFSNYYASGGAYPEGAPPDGELVAVGLLPVRGDAFATLGMRVLSGRTYTGAEETAAADVAVINETMARLFWPGQEAVGKRFRRNRPEEGKPWQTVIGVVADVKRRDLRADAEPEAYFHHEHREGRWAGEMHIVVRAASEPVALAAPLRRVVHDLDPQLAVGAIQSLPDLIARSAAGPRIRTLLATTFAGLAALLAVVGIYGVMAFAVSERRREIGVRMALGARGAGVLAAVLREGALLAVAGVVLGLLGAAAATQLLSSALFGISPLDPPTYVGMAALLAAAALVACWIPARRAARMDPLVALRED